MKKPDREKEQAVAEPPGSIHHVSFREVQKLMRAARFQARQVDRQLDSMPHGWSLADFDPHLLFDAFKHIHLRDGYQLSAYQYYSGGNGNGFVFVIPASHRLPEPDDNFGFDWTPSGAPAFHSGGMPLPEWMNAEVGRFIEGDGSPLSYFQASIFMRELAEMGSLWHGCSWSTHEVLASKSQIPRHRWKWQEKRPREWRPAIQQDPSGLWQVDFYTFTGLDQERIVFHRDTYVEGYRFISEEKAMARGEGGYVF